MNEFNSIDDIAIEIKDKQLAKNNGKKNLSLIYAFNSTGKTRLSMIFNKLGEDKTLCFNAFTEDLFSWDNESYTLNIDNNSWIVALINEQGIEKEITNNFNELTSNKINPNFDLKQGKITFSIINEEKANEQIIKISRGEESLFIWSIFYTILVIAIDELNLEENDRSTKLFNNLEYVVIDDPISSIDDTKIIVMAMRLIDLIDSYNNSNLNFLITTHHALFYNVLYNAFNRSKEYNSSLYVLLKNGGKFDFKSQGESPFGYHLILKEEIKEAIANNNLKKYHFNLFRSLLEKTAVFFGYHSWKDCITGANKNEYVKVINLYSHGNLLDLEYKELSTDDKVLFEKSFNNFIEEFKWEVKRDEQ